MRFLSPALFFIATAVSAQTPPSIAPVLAPANPPPVTVPPAMAANPAAQYITAGQDEPGYRSWYLAAPYRAAQVKSFNDYLASADVAGILPTWQLLRTATAWQDCGGQPFEVPPTVNGPT